MIKLQTKEHLLYFMQSGLMNLSKYDLKFIQNLQSIASTKNKITTNQVALLDKLIDKYQRQFLKQKITKEIISNLPWNTPIVDSDPKFTEAFVYIENDLIKFRSPFSKKFVEALRNHKQHKFKWIKETKNYQSEFSANALKVIIDLAHEHYPTLNFCPSIKELLNGLISKYEPVQYWSPTLVKVNNAYIIAAINTHLYEAVKDIPLSNDPVCLATLARYGIDVSESIVNNNQLLKFASCYMPEVDVNIEDLTSYLTAISCDAVFFSGKSFLNRSNVYSQLLQKLNDEKITYHVKYVQSDSDLIMKHKRPVLINFANNLTSTSNFYKVIKIKNSIQVVIK